VKYSENSFIKKFGVLNSNVRSLKARKTAGTLTSPQKPQKKGVNIYMSEKASDVIFVGNKPPMSYVLAIITAFSSGTQKEITLKARGQAITTAVDVAEITRSRFIKDLKVTKIAIGTAEMPPREGENRSRMVSTIEITLTKA